MKTLSMNREFTITQEGPKIYVNSKVFGFIGQTQFTDHKSLVLARNSIVNIKDHGLGFVLPPILLPLLSKLGIGSIIVQEERAGIMYKYIVVNDDLKMVTYDNRRYAFLPIIKCSIKELKQVLKVPRRTKKRASYKQGAK